MDINFSTALANGQGALLNHTAVSPHAALMALSGQTHLLCHAGFLIARLAQAADAKPDLARTALGQRHLDVAELFAFVCPAQAAVPTPKGMARLLRIDMSDEAAALRSVAETLLHRLENPKQGLIRETAEHATFLARANWPWAPFVMQALLKANPKLDVGTFATGLNVWDRLDEWEEVGPAAKGDHIEVQPEEALQVLRDALGADSEARPQQRDYVRSALHGFAARQSQAFNNILLAEAGTGLGKTRATYASLGVGAEEQRPVWLSTYTKNLQRQLDQETTRLLPNPEEREGRVVIRKGRENYLCLLNMQEALAACRRKAHVAPCWQCCCRWARASRDGDLIGWYQNVFALRLSR